MTAVCRTAGPPDRIKPTPDAENPYEIPSNNFFADGSGRGEIWVFGFRNPWSISGDSETGDVWIADVGDSTAEEIDLLSAQQGWERGRNFGWDQRAGFGPPTPSNLLEAFLPRVVTGIRRHHRSRDSPRGACWRGLRTRSAR